MRCSTCFHRCCMLFQILILILIGLTWFTYVYRNCLQPRVLEGLHILFVLIDERNLWKPCDVNVNIMWETHPNTPRPTIWGWLKSHPQTVEKRKRCKNRHPSLH